MTSSLVIKLFIPFESICWYCHDLNFRCKDVHLSPVEIAVAQAVDTSANIAGGLMWRGKSSAKSFNWHGSFYE